MISLTPNPQPGGPGLSFVRSLSLDQSALNIVYMFKLNSKFRLNGRFSLNGKCVDRLTLLGSKAFLPVV